MTLAARAQGMWRLWIDDRYADETGIAEQSRALAQSRSPCLALTDFWQVEKWRRLHDAVDQLGWERLMVLRDGDEVRVVDEAAFAAASPNSRFSCHDRAIDIGGALNGVGTISAPAQTILREFFAFAVLTPALATWISEVLGGLAVKVGSVEFSRYRAGDFIAQHDDCVGARRCNLVSYLDVGHDQGDGGALRVTGETGEAVFQPRFNMAVLLPLAPTNRHWVEPWRAEPGRNNVSISFVEAV